MFLISIIYEGIDWGHAGEDFRRDDFKGITQNLQSLRPMPLNPSP